MGEKFDIHLREIQVIRPDGELLFSIPDLQVPFGSHLLVQGPSGRGKTTFLHLLAGLFRPAKGSVLIGGVDLNARSDGELCDFRKSKIGVIFQKLNLIDHMTVSENISLALPRLSADESEDLRQRVLKDVNLEGASEKRCSYLSVGEQQRVAVARVLAQRPEIVLADEPTSSLDEKNGEFVLEALKRVSQGKTLIVVSHDQRLLKKFDRVISFEDFCQ